jgi:hypothetical protein
VLPRQFARLLRTGIPEPAAATSQDQRAAFDQTPDDAFDDGIADRSMARVLQ